jgi:malate permease and related proteins
VMMSGMPCAFAGLILAEEYNLNGNLVASSIIVSTLIFLVMIPVWLYVY